MKPQRKTTFHVSIQAVTLVLIGVIALWLAAARQPATQASGLFQSPLPTSDVFRSPLPPPPAFCLTLAQDGYVLGFQGFVTRADGSALLSYQVAANGRQDVSYIAFGTGNWTRLTPADASLFKGGLGDYRVEWTRERGNPGFPSIKFEPQFAGYNQGARDSFTLVVTDFAVTAAVPIEVKAGGVKLTFTLRLDDPQCNLTPRPAVTPAPTSTPTPTIAASHPITQVYVLADRLFVPEARAAAPTAQGPEDLPAPVPVQLTADDQLRARVAQLDRTARAQAPMAIQEAQATSGWSQYYATDFESNFLFDGGPCIWDNYDPGQPRWWERDTQRKWSGSYAIWPAAHPAPAPNQYPNNLTANLICRLDNMAGIENMLVEFKMWLQLYDPGDKFSVLFSGDGVNYRGIQWTGSNNIVTIDWSTYRIYYPELAKTNTGTVYIMWSFQSGAYGQAGGPWLDDLSIQRYDMPTTSANCENLDPRVVVPGVPGGSMVSKGLNLPPFAEDDLNGRLTRVQQSNTGWVRLEFIAAAEPRVATPPGDPTPHFSRIDLKSYDELVDGLCAKGIAVLGLLDQQTLNRSDWQPNQPISDDYRDHFTDVAALLSRYYDTRIGAWEVWNEPDFSGSRVPPASYALLLRATFERLRAEDAGDRVAFGGLGSADPLARDYLIQVYDSTTSPAYDVFALHPYPSTMYRYWDNRLMVNPQDYLHYESPTIVKKFQDVLTARGHAYKSIWATELGWNSAAGSPPAQNCAAINEALVTRWTQASYLTKSFDILFKETGWTSYLPGVIKIFWYQYRDTGACINCQAAAAAGGAQAFAWSPAWNVLAPGATCPPERPNLVDWWFGLYQGDFVSKPAQAAFGCYPRTCSAYLPLLLRP
ncbi:MAG: hypothetical protein AUK03_05795 [Anaerolineae bacterium CG2_30_64_16]|nr:MAG: hypothetical protein AUK03_05795 [Anaerolineae bacterium CG2_30_64_16]